MTDIRFSLSTSRASGSPAPALHALDAWLSRANMAADNDNLNALTLPSGPRAGLESRRIALRDSMAPCPKSKIAALLASLGGMAARSQPDPDTAKALAIQALDDLRDVSEWALAEAVRAYRRGEVGDGRWRPTTGELRLEAKRRETPYRTELWKLNRVLDHPALDAPPVKHIDKCQFEELRRVVAGVVDGGKQ